jgi:hypothetical protein
MSEQTIEEVHTSLDPEVDIPGTEESDEVETVTGATTEQKTDEPKAPAAPKRGALPEGKVTPVEFAKLLSQPLDGNKDNLDGDNWHYTNGKTGSHLVPPQMIYSYVKNSKGLTTETLTDANGVSRDYILTLDQAMAFWNGRGEKAAERAANAKAKAEKAAAKAAAGETAVTTGDGQVEIASTPATEPVGVVEEAE